MLKNPFQSAPLIILDLRETIWIALLVTAYRIIRIR